MLQHTPIKNLINKVGTGISNIEHKVGGFLYNNFVKPSQDYNSFLKKQDDENRRKAESGEYNY